MEWINIYAPTLRAPEYIGSEPAARAAWLNVMVYCAEQENGGRIAGAANWKDRQWQQTCGVTREEILAAAPLITIRGNDVFVWRYPADKEEEVRAKREAGSRGGKAKRKQNGSSASSKTEAELEAEAKQKQSSASTEGEGKGMEGEREVEGERKGGAAAAFPAGPSLSEWMERVKVHCEDRWTSDWWENKHGVRNSTGWKLRTGQEITNWQGYQDSLLVHFRNDLGKHQSKAAAEPKPLSEAEAEAEIARIHAAKQAQMAADQAELKALLAGGRQ